MRCHHCATEVALAPGEKPSRSDSCPKCGKDLRACRNCDHYDTSRRWECREEISERVSEKERGNFCDYFRAGTSVTAKNSAPSKDDLLKQAEALFKKKS